MKASWALLFGGAVFAAAVPSTSANAAALDKGHERFVGTSDVFDCDGDGPGTVYARDDFDFRVNYLRNVRGPSAIPLYQENVRGTIVTTNVATGGTFRTEFAGMSKDQSIVDNGDGTVTITVYAAGGERRYDQYGRLVLKDPGTIRFAFDIDYNSTPGNVDDDTEVEGSFRIVRESTGLNETAGRDFCEDLVEFTT